MTLEPVFSGRAQALHYIPQAICECTTEGDNLNTKALFTHAITCVLSPYTNLVIGIDIIH